MAEVLGTVLLAAAESMIMIISYYNCTTEVVDWFGSGFVLYKWNAASRNF